MRRMLSGLLATAMVASVCATATFAASTAKAGAAYVDIVFADESAPGDLRGDRQD